MALFGWRSQKGRAVQQAPLDTAIGDLFDPPKFLRALDRVVPRYLDSVDRHEVIYPACTRTLADAHGTVRAIWESLDMTRTIALHNGLAYTHIGNNPPAAPAPKKQPPSYR